MPGPFIFLLMLLLAPITFPCTIYKGIKQPLCIFVFQYPLRMPLYPDKKGVISNLYCFCDTIRRRGANDQSFTGRLDPLVMCADNRDFTRKYLLFTLPLLTLHLLTLPLTPSHQRRGGIKYSIKESSFFYQYIMHRPVIEGSRNLSRYVLVKAATEGYVY